MVMVTSLGTGGVMGPEPEEPWLPDELLHPDKTAPEAITALSNNAFISDEQHIPESDELLHCEEAVPVDNNVRGVA